MKPTAAPWIAERGRVYSIDATGSIVAQCIDFQFAPRPRSEAEANAELITQACNGVQRAAQTLGVDPVILAMEVEDIIAKFVNITRAANTRAANIGPWTAAAQLLLDRLEKTR